MLARAGRGLLLVTGTSAAPVETAQAFSTNAASWAFTQQAERPFWKGCGLVFAASLLPAAEAWKQLKCPVSRGMRREIWCVRSGMLLGQGGVGLCHFQQRGWTWRDVMLSERRQKASTRESALRRGIWRYGRLRRDGKGSSLGRRE